jgi:hypothetical protein
VAVSKVYPATQADMAGPGATGTILPVQWFVNSTAARTGEQRLMEAVLEDAIAAYLKRIPPSSDKLRQTFQRIRQETEHWIRSDDRKSMFSFLRICDALELEPEYLRRGLRLLHEQALTDGRQRRTRTPAAHRGAAGAGVAAVLGTQRAT